ncbi:MAG TPA: KEOPS complex subunit Cgi121 [Methanocorpusculum sp.]|nr:KEOPS complex subunit Cgi121 [Methanocorpusculum sp.]HJK01982.1 KEOPS complex subunit Cgi121 [Methanocorpusculum sp.]
MRQQSTIIYEAKAVINDITTTLSQINTIAKKTTSTIVLFNARKIAGYSHIYSAILHAKRSYTSKKPISRTLAMEILLYASGQRQCSLALQFGLHKGKNVLFVVIIDGKGTKAQELLNEIILPEKHGVHASQAVLMKDFGITKEELQVVGKNRIDELIIERIALVDVYK